MYMYIYIYIYIYIYNIYAVLLYATAGGTRTGGPPVHCEPHYNTVVYGGHIV